MSAERLNDKTIREALFHDISIHSPEEAQAADVFVLAAREISDGSCVIAFRLHFDEENGEVYLASYDGNRLVDVVYAGMEYETRLLLPGTVPAGKEISDYTSITCDFLPPELIEVKQGTIIGLKVRGARDSQNYSIHGDICYRYSLTADHRFSLNAVIDSVSGNCNEDVKEMLRVAHIPASEFSSMMPQWNAAVKRVMQGALKGNKEEISLVEKRCLVINEGMFYRNNHQYLKWIYDNQKSEKLTQALKLTLRHCDEPDLLLKALENATTTFTSSKEKKFWKKWLKKLK